MLLPGSTRAVSLYQAHSSLEGSPRVSQFIFHLYEGEVARTAVLGESGKDRLQKTRALRAQEQLLFSC